MEKVEEKIPPPFPLSAQLHGHWSGAHIPGKDSCEEGMLLISTLCLEYHFIALTFLHQLSSTNVPADKTERA